MEIAGTRAKKHAPPLVESGDGGGGVGFEIGESFVMQMEFEK